ncbi:hypothetical protein HAX54_035186 [Datura stramonium]|uniref:Uncharacterized protein n=1 Tax=Datura stramonium TaxID=4076 RepID=A0ABS8VF12_DATST|nr:hypothetical protein [Datura stramonium]
MRFADEQDRDRAIFSFSVPHGPRLFRSHMDGDARLTESEAELDLRDRFRFFLAQLLCAAARFENGFSPTGDISGHAFWALLRAAI